MRGRDAETGHDRLVILVLDNDLGAAQQDAEDFSHHRLNQLCATAFGDEQPAHAGHPVHGVRNPRQMRGQRPVQHGFHRHVMRDIRALCTVYPDEAQNRAEFAEHIGPAPRDLEMDHLDAMLPDLFGMLVGARDDNHIKAGVFCAEDLRQPVRTDEPVFGGEIQQFWAVILHRLRAYFHWTERAFVSLASRRDFSCSQRPASARILSCIATLLSPGLKRCLSCLA